MIYADPVRDSFYRDVWLVVPHKTSEYLGVFEVKAGVSRFYPAEYGDRDPGITVDILEEIVQLLRTLNPVAHILIEPTSV